MQEEQTSSNTIQNDENLSPKIEHFDGMELTEDDEEMKEAITEMKAIKESDTDQIIAFENEVANTSIDNLHYVEYEEVEYLENGAGEIANLYEIRNDTDEAGSTVYYCLLCKNSCKTEFGVQYHLYFHHSEGPSKLNVKLIFLIRQFI